MANCNNSPWLVLRTKSRHENIAEKFLLQRKISAFLPKYKNTRTRMDRRITIESPLFPGYIFVQPIENQLYQLRTIPGSCGLLIFGNKPAEMPINDLAAIKTMINSGASLSVHPQLIPGRKVEVLSGPFQGVKGELVRVKNQQRLLINAHLVGKSVDVEIDTNEVEFL